MSMSTLRAARCPNCGLTFEASAKRTQRCPVCGRKFSLSEGPSGAVSGVRLESPAYDSSRPRQRMAPPASPISRQDRAVGAALFSAGSAVAVWLGLEFSLIVMVVLGLVGLAIVLRGAIASSLWWRYDDLSLSSRLFADLPRLVVWTIGRVLAAIIEFVFKVVEGGFGGGFG